MKIKTDYNNKKITLYHTECTASTNLDAKAIKNSSIPFSDDAAAAIIRDYISKWHITKCLAAT